MDPYITVDHRVLDHLLSLGCPAVPTYLVIAQHHFRDRQSRALRKGGTFLSRETIAQGIGRSIDTAKAGVRILKRAGLIEVEVNAGKNGSNVYHLTPPERLTTPVQRRTPQGESRTASTGCNDAPPLRGATTPPVEQSRREKKIEDLLSSESKQDPQGAAPPPPQATAPPPDAANAPDPKPLSLKAQLGLERAAPSDAADGDQETYSWADVRAQLADLADGEDPAAAARREARAERQKQDDERRELFQRQEKEIKRNNKADTAAEVAAHPAAG